MVSLNEYFYWSVVFAVIIEIILFVVIIVYKKKLISEDSRKVFVDNKNLFFISVGFMIVALLSEFVGEISELFEKEYLLIESLIKFHMTFLLVSLILIAWLTYKMARGK